MTCEYDGHLVVRVKGKGIEPCCAAMHQAIILGVVYRGTEGKMPCAKIRIGDREGLTICRCPFRTQDGRECGANVEVVE